MTASRGKVRLAFRRVDCTDRPRLARITDNPPLRVSARPTGRSMQIHVTAPSRLHLGMFSFGRPDVRQFGGVGMMVNDPPTRLEVTPAAEFHATGHEADRAVDFARRVVSAG